MKSALYLLLAALPFLSLQASADSLSEIAAFADKICTQSLTGNESSTSVVANLNGDVNGLAKALGITVNAGGLVKHDGTRYEGIPKDKLPSSIPTPAQCKLEVARLLIDEREKLAQNKPALDSRTASLLAAHEVAPDLVVTFLGEGKWQGRPSVDVQIVNRGRGKAILKSMRLQGLPPSRALGSGVDIYQFTYTAPVEIPVLPRTMAPFKLTPLTPGPTAGLILFLSFADELGNILEYSQAVR